MKFLKLSFLFVLGALVFTSCSKEDVIDIQDDMPEVTPTEVVSEINLRGSSITVAQAVLFVTYQEDGLVDYYSLSVDADQDNPSPLLGIGYFPSEEETGPQAIDYVGSDGATLSAAGIALMEEWIAAGSNGNPPSLITELKVGDASNVTLTLSNVTEDQVDVTLNGYFIDEESGEEVPVSGSFTAEVAEG